MYSLLRWRAKKISFSLEDEHYTWNTEKSESTEMDAHLGQSDESGMEEEARKQ